MKVVVYILFILSLIIAPFFVFADCSNDGTTVIFINGVFGDEISAKKDNDFLEKKFKTLVGNDNVFFINGFNSSHVAGLDDLVKSAVQAYGKDSLDYDLKNILIEVHKELKTQKVLLVGHSQGTFYTNAAYNYLVENGVDKNSIAVYNVATPDEKVGGGGNYLTSSTDKVINSIVKKLTTLGFANKPLPANIDLKLSEIQEKSPIGGHSFGEVYLQEAPDIIIGGIDKEINSLKSGDSEKSECFVEPKINVVYKLQGAGYKIVDTSIAYLDQQTPTSPFKTPQQLAAVGGQIVDGVYGFGKNVFSWFQDVVVKVGPGVFVASMQDNNPVIDEQESENTQSDTDLEVYNGIGGPDIHPETVQGKQDLLDDMQEKLDILLNRLKLLQNQQDPDEKKFDEDRGNGGSANYPKILISEVQIASETDEKQEFVELYNPNDVEVSLTDWYLQRKTEGSSSWLTYAPSNLFLGKKISPHGYFLIARTGYYSDIAGIFTDNPITGNNSFALKNPNGDISDSADFKTINPQADQSIGRKNISEDFELQTPTPLAPNKAYNAPIIVPPVPLKNILINEIQISGESAKDEFIELYNPNDVEVNLSGFSLKKKTSTGTESNLASSASFSGVIPAFGYFLIAPQNNDDGTPNYTGLAYPDLRYSGKGYSIAPDNTVLIYNSLGVLLDKVGMGDAVDFETTPTTNPDEQKSIERKIIGGDTDNNSVDFRISDSPTPKANFMQAGIQDATDYSASFANRDGIWTYNLLIKWQSQSQNLDFYQLQYKINSGDWTEWISKTTDTSGNFTAYYHLLNEQNMYSFRVKSFDKAGNQSDWQEANVDLSVPVVINEAGFFGTNSSQNDQWFELYNRSDKDVDLTGWRMISQGSNLILSGVIPAKGYFILEEKDDETLSDVKANQVFGEKYQMILYAHLLDNKNRYVDELFIKQGGWNQGDFTQNGNRYSLERISAYAFGFEEKNWRLNNGKTINGSDRSQNAIYGTPGSQNSDYQIYTVLPQVIAQDTRLSKSLNTYICKDSVKIMKGAVLFIDPGSILKFYNMCTFTVDGTIKAIGNSSDKIIFTSYLDDANGGDTNEDNGLNAPSAGNWIGINLTNNSINSEFDNSIFQYGGFSLELLGAVVKADQSPVSVKNSIFENNKNRGLFLVNSNAIIDNSQFLSQPGSAEWDFKGRGIDVLGGSVQISNNYFKDNNYGVVINKWSDSSGNVFDANVSVQNNNFENNIFPVSLKSFVGPSFSQNKASENVKNAILIDNEKIEKDLLLKVDLPYLISYPFTVPEGITLTLEPGVIMNFGSGDAEMLINGTLKAVGTADQPIIFRYYYYDTEELIPGKWRGLQFSKTSKDSDLENIDISQAGDLDSHGDYGAAIRVIQSSIILKDSKVWMNKNSGVWLQNSPSVIDNVQFFDHRKVGDYWFAAAIQIQGGSPEVKNSIFERQTYGIYKANWRDSETGEVIPPTPNLHIGDAEENKFSDTDVAGGEIYTSP